MREGGCVCGAVRYRLKGDPVRIVACHCTFCRKRTGSAFGVGVYFKAEDVEFTRGELHNYEHRSDESERWLRVEFCPKCGANVTWTLQMRPGARAVSRQPGRSELAQAAGPYLDALDAALGGYSGRRRPPSQRFGLEAHSRITARE